MPININFFKPRRNHQDNQEPPEISEMHQPKHHQEADHAEDYFPAFFNDRFFGNPFRDAEDFFNSTNDRFQFRSAMHMKEDPEQVQITLEVPGMSRRDLNVTVNELPSTSCVVHLKSSRTDDDDTYNHNPNRFIPRRFEFGPSVDCQKVSATISQGMLYLQAPKKQAQEGITRTLDVAEKDN
mmetsp:Transcript_18726/g.52084  ORF Transcript_18726/g.52084 Transcript_18726/m.52084 type:complete len:182 (-) Transcript_18726:1796-2341(-)